MISYDISTKIILSFYYSHSLKLCVFIQTIFDKSLQTRMNVHKILLYSSLHFVTNNRT